MSFKTIVKTIIFSLFTILFLSCGTSKQHKITSEEKLALTKSNIYIKKIDSLITLSRDMEFSTKYITQRITEGSTTLFDSLKVQIGTGSFLRDLYKNQEMDEVVKVMYSASTDYNEYSISKNGVTFERKKMTVYYKKEKAYVIVYNVTKHNEKDVKSDTEYRFQVDDQGTIKTYSDNHKNEIAAYVLKFSKQVTEDKWQ